MYSIIEKNKNEKRLYKVVYAKGKRSLPMSQNRE